MESIRETFDSIPDDVKNQIYLCAGLIDDLTDKQKEVAKHVLLECCEECPANHNENDDMDAMLEHLWNDVADEESEEEP